MIKTKAETRPLRHSQVVHRINGSVKTTFAKEEQDGRQYSVHLVGQYDLYKYEVVRARSVNKRLQVLTCFGWQTVADSERVEDSSGCVLFPAVNDDLFDVSFLKEFAAIEA